jgi:hypothetical protein
MRFLTPSGKQLRGRCDDRMRAGVVWPVCVCHRRTHAVSFKTYASAVCCRCDTAFYVCWSPAAGVACLVVGIEAQARGAHIMVLLS